MYIICIRTCAQTVDQNLLKFLRTFKSNFPNPFQNKGFELSCMETFTEGADVHKILTIKLIYHKNTLIIKFLKEDFLLALAITLSVQLCIFDFDENTKITFKDKTLSFPNNPCCDQIPVFIKIVNELENHLDAKNQIIFTYENTENGRDSFNFHKQCIFFIIDDMHEDEYYCNKEFSRWYSPVGTDDEI